MISFDYSWGLASIGLVVCIIMLIISKPFVTFNWPQKNNVAKGIVFFFMIYTLNSIFSFWEWDTYHSWRDFIEARNYESYNIIIYEPVYNWLALLSGNHYFIWRTLIWVPACFFIYLAGRKLTILNRNFLLAIALFLAFQTCTRNLLGLSMMLLGLVFLFKDNSPSRIFGLALIIASYFFHKTMYITLLFAMLALLPQNKKTIILLLFLFPLFSMASTYLVNNILSEKWIITMGVLGEGSNKVLDYVSSERKVSTIYGIIEKIISYLPQYVSLIYVTKRIFFDDILEDDKQKKIWTYLCRFSFVCIYIASTFYFTETSSWIYIRFKYMGLIPLTFVIAKTWSVETHTNNWIKSIIILQLIALSYRWIVQWWHWA